MNLIETLLLKLGHMKIISLLKIQLLPFIAFILQFLELHLLNKLTLHLV